MPALPNLRLISHKSSICFFERFAWQAVFSRPFFQKNYPHSLAKCLSCRCRQQREKYAVLRQEQSVSCQSKILPRYHNSLSAHSVPSESCWGVPSPNPAIRSLTAAATSPSDRALQAPSPRKVLNTARTATSSRSQHRRIFLTGILNKRQISVR